MITTHHMQAAYTHIGTSYVLQWKKICILLSILSLVLYIFFGVQFIDSYKGHMETKCVRPLMINGTQRLYSAYVVYSALGMFLLFQPIISMFAILAHFARDDSRVVLLIASIASYTVFGAFLSAGIYTAGINHCFDEVSSLKTLLYFSIGFGVAQPLLICLLLPEVPRTLFDVAHQFPKRIFNFFVKKEYITVV